MSVQAQENIFPRMVGRWREVNTATTIVVQPDGKVFSAGGPIYGSVQPSNIGGGNFEFENENMKCVYDIEFLAGGLSASWGLRFESNPGTCPKTGLFYRAHDPEEEDWKEREEQEDPAPKAPPEMEGIDLVYFERSSDNGKVAKALDAANIVYSTRPSSQLVPSNIITCTPDVPATAIRKLAEILINAEVPIRMIKPSKYPEFPMRMTVESSGIDNEVPDVPVLTKSQIRSIMLCPDPSRNKVYFRKKCQKSDVHVHVYYQRAMDERWAQVYQYSIASGETRQISDDKGNEIFTNLNFVWYYARSEWGNLQWVGSDNTVLRNIPGDASPKRFRKSRQTTVTLDCPHQQN